MPHIWGKKYPSGVGSSSTCIRNQKTSYSWIFSTKPGGQVCKHKFGLPLRLLFYYLACQSTERIPSLQEMLHFFCPLWNQLPQKDPGQKSQEGTAFQQPLRDEILQPVGLLPSVLHTPGRDPAPELQTTLWLTLISGEEVFVNSTSWEALEERVCCTNKALSKPSLLSFMPAADFPHLTGSQELGYCEITHQRWPALISAVISHTRGRMEQCLNITRSLPVNSSAVFAPYLKLEKLKLNLRSCMTH